jgi:peptide/nickel transport system permease protein
VSNHSIPETAVKHPALPARSRMTQIFGNPWIQFAIRRSIGFVVAIIALIIVAFLIVQLIPGDPARAVAGEDATPAQVEVVRQMLGLDQPLVVQAFHYFSSIFTGDFGTSYQYKQPVMDIIVNRFPFTATIASIGIVIVLGVGVPLGMFIGVTTRDGRRSWLDTAFGSATGILDSIPGYIMATLLVLTFAVGVGLIPILPPSYSVRTAAPSFVLPIAALVIGPICTISRIVRRETSVVLDQDFIRTARGWRLPPRTIYTRYALTNLLTSVLTVSGLVLTGMLGGAIIIESVFALPGLGSGIIKAILDRDYPLIQGFVIVLGTVAVLINLLVDIILGLVDPRTLGGSHGDH